MLMSVFADKLLLKLQLLSFLCLKRPWGWTCRGCNM